MAPRAIALVASVIGLFAVVNAVPDPRPLYIHLALTGNVSEMAVAWFTTGPTNVSIVRFGVESGNHSFEAVGESRTFNESVGWVHDVKLTGLNAHTRYYYTVGSPDARSGEFYFNTTTHDFQPFAVPMYGDFGVRNSIYTVPDLNKIVADRGADFIFHVGDISYANDYDSHQFEEVWSEWFQETSKFMPYIPYMVCPGNHEYRSGAPFLPYSDNFAPYRYRFRMPWRESGSTAGNNMWFSFDYHNVHFVAVDTETDFPGAPEAEKLFGDQLTWLEQDLATTRKPWIIVGGHRPIYSAARGYVQDGKPVGATFWLQKAMEDLFHKYHVDMFVVGHQHAYERQWPVYQNVVTARHYDNPPSTVHIIAGSAGCEEGIAADWYVPRPEWSAYRYPPDNRFREAFGYGVLNVLSDTELRWDFIASRTLETVDTITITKNSTRSWA